MAHSIVDNTEARRFELWDGDDLAALATYGRAGGTLAITHVETEDGFGGRGLATELVAHVIGVAQEEGLGVLPFCPFAKAYILDHPETRTLVPAGHRADFGLA